MTVGPFILRSETRSPSPADLARRETIIMELSDADIERIGGATNNHPYPDYYPASWNPSSGADMGSRVDHGGGGSTPTVPIVER